MALDPRAERLLAMLAVAPGVAPSRMTAEERRHGFEGLMRMAGPAPAIAAVTDTRVAGAEGALPARLYVPLGDRGAGMPGLVYFHGGGLVAGSLETHDPLCRRLAAAAGCRVVAVAYRLAPEHRFPAAVDDGSAASGDVLDRAAAFGLDPARIALGGDSAGATLATVAALHLRRRQGARPACQLLLCPVLDMRGATPSRQAYGQGYLLDAALMARDLADYAPGAADLDDPRLSPLRTPDLAGAAPALIYTAEFDPLRDEGAAYAERLRAAGVPVQFRCHAGMIHHFYGLTGFIPAAGALLAGIGHDLATALSA